MSDTKTLPEETDAQPEKQVPSFYALDLTKGGPKANIHLAGQVYTLRVTKTGKLILTK